MEYDVYKKIIEHCQLIMKISTGDIMQTLGQIEESNWGDAELKEIKKAIEEKINELDDLQTSFAIEVKINADEDEDRVERYFSKLDEELNNYREAFLKMVEFWDHDKSLDQNYISIDSIKKLVTLLENFIDILLSYEPLPPPQLIKEFTARLIYLQFSGIIDAIRKSLKEKLNKGHITNVRLAETLALITDENQVTIEKLLSKLTHLTQGNPHPVFTDEMLGKAITHLEKDGFDASKLEAILQKMHKTNL